MLRWTHEQHILEDVDPQAAKVQRSNADQTKALVLPREVTERSQPAGHSLFPSQLKMGAKRGLIGIPCSRLSTSQTAGSSEPSKLISVYLLTYEQAPLEGRSPETYAQPKPLRSTLRTPLLVSVDVMCSESFCHLHTSYPLSLPCCLLHPPL